LSQYTTVGFEFLSCSHLTNILIIKSHK